jgi:aspartyl-tRNA(Asn)/glutamyl-tRNA(Gln) amidotransferase subunit A
LVDAYRRGERNPVDEVDAALSAIEASDLNAFSHIDPESAQEAAVDADISLPLGGVPIAVKQLHEVEGWPATEASLVFADRVADHDITMVSRLREAGAILVGATTASEFGGLNVGTTPINGVTHNPWQRGATPGGSSSGSAAAVAAGLVPIATGGDGGGSIRIPAGFCGLVGMKGTAGRIPRGPHTMISPMTVVSGCMSRSVRDAARWYDVCAGFDSRDPYSLPFEQEWEAQLGKADLSGLRIGIDASLGGAIISNGVRAAVDVAAEKLAQQLGATIVPLNIEMPPIAYEWALANQASIRIALGDLWPGCKEQLTPAMALGVEMAEELFDIDMAARVESQRTAANERMAALFDQVDIVLCASNPDIAFPAEVEVNTRVDGEKVSPGNNGALTIPANISGNPACSVPVGLHDGLPVGMEIMATQHQDRLVLDVARAWEQLSPWPLVADSTT